MAYEKRYYYVKNTMMTVCFLRCAFYQTTLLRGLIVLHEVMHVVGRVRSQG